MKARSARRLSPRRQALLRLAVASRQRLLELTHAHDIDFEQADGVLVLLRHERALKAHRAWLALLAEQGLAFELVDARRAREIEPALNPAAPLRAAIHLP
jgi:glycine/D-amino acid oxidase-like deaminating enzyme